jgi:glycosyltransferase involved in cell wall biosynthesis
MLGECAPALTAARSAGLRVITEIYILLSADSIVEQERLRYPDWEPIDLEYETFRRELSPEKRLLANTDFAICPSEAVREDLVANFGFRRESATVLPYGVEDEWLGIQNRPVPGRILFAGSACLRKGIHYLALASEILAAHGRKYEFRVAGDVSDSIRNHPRCRLLHFLGRIPRYHMIEELRTADVFVLPTLAEGSAEVIYQALAAGVPVVTTNAAGSVVRNGIEGLIVPERDAESLADALSGIVEDRGRRTAIAIRANRLAADYTWTRYGDRLRELLQTV